MVIRKVLRDLQLENDCDDDCAIETITAEYIRCIVALSGNHGIPIHINRILSSVRGKLGFILPDVKDEWEILKTSVYEPKENSIDPVSNILKGLTSIRDISHIGKGFYVPTPFRLVELPHTGFLAIGCMPTREVIKTLGRPVQSVGILRYIVEDMQKCDSMAKQSFSNWIGYNLQPVKDWSVRYLKKAMDKLVISGLIGLSFEVYDPVSTSTNLQYYRWIDSHDWSGRERQLYLCRTKIAPKRYWLALLRRRDNDVYVIRECDLTPSSDIRRLQYGFDILAEKPTIANINLIKKKLVVEFYNDIPNQEKRFFSGFSLKSNQRGKFPQKYNIPKDFLSDVVFMLSNLGVKIRGI